MDLFETLGNDLKPRSSRIKKDLLRELDALKIDIKCKQGVNRRILIIESLIGTL